MKRYGLLIGTGLAVGAAAVLLTYLGNPANMGFCIACFLRDIAGALNFQRAGFDAEVGTGIVQYIRPEVIGLVLGSTAIAFVRGEFKPKGGSSPMLRFVVAVFVMIGALVFLGCPLRMVIRIGGGDLNAVVGLAGFAIGILIGIQFLQRGFSLRRAYQQSMAEGLIFPVLMAALLALLLIGPDFIVFSAKGPGSMAAPVLVALAVALVIGVLAQRSRLCMVGGIRDAVMFKDFRLISAFIAIIAAVLVGNLVLGSFKLGFAEQPIAHSEAVWNLLGMVLVGWGSVLLGGCPLRQLILAGEGNSDSAVTVTGFIVGAAVSHNFGLASSATGIGTGPVAIAVAAGFVVLAVVSVMNTQKL
ncbi:MAG: YedE-related selenium metabolism membrane protein [Oscillospiraceae bacterium]|nr:YedE-related selenium metabolism membrane protein [Oscillospiraceae bacterium]MCI8715007.1 YedE-related selenium metabolism membrane protein [Oscillospiraceae bacterium]MCI9317100.1 YedE-related selenium metabolism membrane protein [Oscillospiraceae bacterium]